MMMMVLEKEVNLSDDDGGTWKRGDMMVVLEKEVNPRGWGRWCRLPPVDCFGPTQSAPQVCLAHSHVIIIIFGVILIHNERGGDFRRGQCDLLLISVSTGRDSLPSEGSLKLLIQIHSNQNEGGVNYTPAHQVITIINDDSLEIMILISNQQGWSTPNDISLQMCWVSDLSWTSFVRPARPIAVTI